MASCSGQKKLGGSKLFEALVIIVAGFLCGSLNAIAGGGTFVTLPALIWIGVPPVVANATATTMAAPGYFASVWAYRRDIRAEGTLGLGSIIALTSLGGIAGALLLIVTPPDAFLGLIPWLLLTATLLFALAPHMLTLLERHDINVGSPIVAGIFLLVIMTYGGYFNGGLGIIMLAALSLQGYRNLHGMNGLKNILSFVLALLSIATFATADLIAWETALPMAMSNICGAYFTARIVRRLERTELLRLGIIGIGLTMTALFFLT